MASKSKGSSSKGIWQIIGLIMLLLCLLSISVISTLTAVGVVKLEQPTRAMGSMMDAEDMCSGLIRDDYQETLSSFHVDDFSSRFNEETGQYMMFYEVELKRDINNPSGVNKYFLNCFVSTKGRLAMFDIFEEKTFVPKASRRSTGNAFGL